MLAASNWAENVPTGHSVQGESPLVPYVPELQLVGMDDCVGVVNEPGPSPMPILPFPKPQQWTVSLLVEAQV
jgi:hypothetical protein